MLWAILFALTLNKCKTDQLRLNQATPSLQVHAGGRTYHSTDTLAAIS